MRRSTTTLGSRGTILCFLLAFALTGAAIASADSTTPSANSSSKTQSLKSKTTSSKSSGSTSQKTTTHSSSSHKTTSQKSASHNKNSKKLRSSKKRGQQAIDSTRARQIQEALIREHYLQGEPSGSWDSATQVAMERYQADQGWQTKTTPDSRALIKLGLGPSHDHLLNPESAMTSAGPKNDPKNIPPAATAPSPASTDRPQD
jgi:hypothetical protein